MQGERGDHCLADAFLLLAQAHQNAHGDGSAGLGHLRAAKAALEQALALYREIGDLNSQGAALVNLGVVAWASNEDAEAIQLLDDALELSRQLGGANWEQNTLRRRHEYMATLQGAQDMKKAAWGAAVEIHARRKKAPRPAKTTLPNGRDFIEALLEGHRETVGYALTKNPAVASYKDVDGSTPLHFVNSAWDAKCILREIPRDQRNRVVSAKNEQGRTPLHHALERGDSALVRLLLNHGAATNARDATGKTPVDVAADTGNAKLLRLVTRRRWRWWP
jgi:tetratricopeptide (TPR) repeat protein